MIGEFWEKFVKLDLVFFKTLNWMHQWHRGGSSSDVVSSPSDDEMIKSCLSINISVTFILSAPPGASLDSQFNILIKFSLSLAQQKSAPIRCWISLISKYWGWSKFNCVSCWLCLATSNINQLFRGVFLYFSVHTFPPHKPDRLANWHTPTDGPEICCLQIIPHSSANKQSGTNQRKY